MKSTEKWDERVPGAIGIQVGSSICRRRHQSGSPSGSSPPKDSDHRNGLSKHCSEAVGLLHQRRAGVVPRISATKHAKLKTWHPKSSLPKKRLFQEDATSVASLAIKDPPLRGHSHKHYQKVETTQGAWHATSHGPL